MVIAQQLFCYLSFYFLCSNFKYLDSSMFLHFFSTSPYPIVLSHVLPHTLGLFHCACLDFWILAIIKLQFQSQSNLCFICLDTFCCFFNFKLHVCILHLLKCLFIILIFLSLIFFSCNDF